MAEKIELTFLGTGSAIPTARRNHPAMLLKYKDENILFDCGEGTQRQFRKAKLNPCKITKILISHWHGDHTLGLPGLLQTMILNGYNRKLEIYGPKGTKEKVKGMLDVFMKWYLGNVLKGSKGLNLEVSEVSEGVFFDNDDFYLESVSLEHGIETNAYSFVVKEKNRLDKKKLEKLKLPNSPLIGELTKGKTVKIDGKKIDGKNLMYKDSARKVSFVMDTRVCDNAVRISKEADVLVIESTYSAEESDVAKEYNHMTCVDSATVAKKAKAKKLILIHLSQRYDAVPKLIEREAAKIFKNVSVVEDLERIEV